MLVLKKLLNGLTMNKITIIIDAKEHRQIVLVWSLYSEILFEFIIILLYYYIIIIIYFLRSSNYFYMLKIFYVFIICLSIKHVKTIILGQKIDQGNIIEFLQKKTIKLAMVC
jgi:hypothetical protein